MSLSEYFTEIVKLIEKYAHSGLIVGSDFNNDYRTEKSGVIKGNLLFNDGSKLYFTEYIDTRYGVEKLTYSYHYQNKRGKLIFRLIMQDTNHFYLLKAISISLMKQ